MPYTKYDTMPKPRIDEDLASQIRQHNAVIAIAEQQGDLRLMIQSMADRALLFQQAVRESS